MRAKLRHLSWKCNFVLALFEEDTFFLRLRSGEKRKKRKSDEAGERDLGKGGCESKNAVQNAKFACVRYARASSVFTFLCSPLHLLLVFR